MLTDAELQQAAAALDIIEERGNQNEFDCILRQYREAARGNGHWVPGSIGYNLGCDAIASELARLLDEPKARCLRAAYAVYGGDPQRSAFNALLAYAAELTGRPAVSMSAKATNAPRPIIRVVLEEART